MNYLLVPFGFLKGYLFPPSETLDLVCETDLTESAIIEKIMALPDLVSVDLSPLQLSDRVLIALQENCPKLKRLTHVGAFPFEGGDIFYLSGKIRKAIQENIDLEQPQEIPGWKRAVELIGGPETLMTAAGIEAIAKMHLDILNIPFHPRLDSRELSPLVGKVKKIILLDRRYDPWDPEMLKWHSKGTLISTGREKR